MSVETIGMDIEKRMCAMGKINLGSILGFGVLLVMIGMMNGCTTNLDSIGHTKSSAKEEGMNLDKPMEKATPVMPVMDAAAPAAFETASFGLG